MSMSDPTAATGRPLNKIDAAEARGYQKAIDALRDEGAKALERFAEAHSDSPGWDMYDSAADWLETVREDHVPAPTVHEGGTE